MYIELKKKKKTNKVKNAAIMQFAVNKWEKEQKSGKYSTWLRRRIFKDKNE